MFKKIILVLLFILPISAFANHDSLHLILVNGVAEASVDPNLAHLHIESWGKAATAKAAQETQAAQYKKILSVVDKYKIKKDDYKTENFSVNPDYVYDQKMQRNKITGYRASHQIVITFRKIEDVGALVDDLAATAKADAVSGVAVQNISWETDKRSMVESSVINDAVRGARAKADELAKAAGVKIKAVHKITHSSFAPPPYAENFRASMVADKAVGAGTELSAGKIKIRVEVQMEFEI